MELTLFRKQNDYSKAQKLVSNLDDSKAVALMCPNKSVLNFTEKIIFSHACGSAVIV